MSFAPPLYIAAAIRRHTCAALVASLSIFVLLSLGIWGCQPEPPNDSPYAGGSATPVSSPGVPGGGTPATAPVYPQDLVPPTIVIESPESGLAITEGSVRLVARATDNFGLAHLSLAVEPNLPQSIPLPADDGLIDMQVPVGYGTRTLLLRARDVGGNEAIAAAVVVRPFGGSDAEPPVLWVDTPAPAFVLATPSLLVRGRSADDSAVAEVTVSMNGGEAVRADTQNDFATWALHVVPPPGPVQLRVQATDLVGRKTASLTNGLAVYPGDSEPPLLEVLSPSDGQNTADDTVLVKGTAADPSGIAVVEVRVEGGPYVKASTTNNFAHWESQVALQPGANAIRVRAIDKAGLSTIREFTVFNTSGQDWGPVVEATLRWSPPAYDTLQFDLDRAGVAAIVPPSIASGIILHELDPEPLISAALSAIKDGCGPGWWVSGFTPNCPAEWSQREVNLWRLVTMTPANADVAGTSVAGVKQLADLLSEIGLISAFGGLLADALSIDIHHTFLTAPSVAGALVDGIIKTHPSALANGRLPISLQDALTDMASFGPRFGAAGAHPGFIDTAAGGIHAVVMGPSFLLSLKAKSNQHWHEGMVLAPGNGAGKGFLPFLADVTGPSFSDPLEIDFLDPSTFTVQGLEPDPRVDFAFRVFEHPDWVPVGDSPWPLPRGNSAVWNISPWFIESAVADASFRSFATHRSGCDFCPGPDAGALLYEDPLFGIDQAEIVVGRHGYAKFGGQKADNFPFIDPNPSGWMRVWTLFGLGSPPPPQYVWDMILEVAQKRLLDGGITQGEGHVLFRLKQVPVGLTGDAVLEAMRPLLQAQKEALVAQLLGPAGAQSSPVDFYLARLATGALALVFAHPSDPLPAGTSAHTTPGFFLDSTLNTKVSIAETDSPHEYLPLGPSAQTVYCQSRAGQVWRIEASALAGDEVDIRARRWLGAP